MSREKAEINPLVLSEDIPAEALAWYSDQRKVQRMLRKTADNHCFSNRLGYYGIGLTACYAAGIAIITNCCGFFWRHYWKFSVLRSKLGNDDFVSIKDLAKRLGMDRSNARRYVLKLGYAFHKRRTPDSGSQLTLCVTSADADEIASQRADNGFIASTVVNVSDVGVFYVIQLVPDLDPKRLKLGFAESLEQRLSQHRTAAPTARVLRAWPCKRTWELTTIDALTREGCRLILNEVFECDDPDVLLKRGDNFFSILPAPGIRAPLASASPLNSADPGGEDAKQPATADRTRHKHYGVETSL